MTTVETTLKIYEHCLNGKTMSVWMVRNGDKIIHFIYRSSSDCVSQQITFVPKSEALPMLLEPQLVLEQPGSACTLALRRFDNHEVRYDRRFSNGSERIVKSTFCLSDGRTLDCRHFYQAKDVDAASSEPAKQPKPEKKKKKTHKAECPKGNMNALMNSMQTQAPDSTGIYSRLLLKNGRLCLKASINLISPEQPK